MKGEFRKKTNRGYGTYEPTMEEGPCELSDELETINVKLKAFGVTSVGRPFSNNPEEVKKTIRAYNKF